MFDFNSYYPARSLAQALALLAEHPQARLIAGGSDVLIKLRSGKLTGCELISIYQVEELRGVSLDAEQALRILPLTSFSHLAAHPLIRSCLPVLGQAAEQVGGPQLRNIGSIGGNICNGATSADTASTLLAFDAQLELTSLAGQRLLPVSQFYLAAGQVDIRPGELLTAILVPQASYQDYYGEYIKYAMRNAMDIATLGCSCNVKLSPDKQNIASLRLAFGVAGPTPRRAVSAEALAQGQPLTADLPRRVAQAALDDLAPRDSWRASREFRLHLAAELTERALRRSVELAGGAF